MNSKKALKIIAKDKDIKEETYRVLFLISAHLNFENWVPIHPSIVAQQLDLEEQYVTRAIQLLEEKEIILRGSQAGHSYSFMLNPDFAWEVKVKNFDNYRKECNEFLDSTSHELRTPLNGIIGFLKLILDGMADDQQEQQEFIEQAHYSALRLLNLINDILDVAKIEAGEIEFQFMPISLNEICQDVYKFTHKQAQEKNIDFDINIPATYDQIIIYADYQCLLQVMLNLVGNALKFTRKGKVEIKAEIISKKVNVYDLLCPPRVKISISDTGIGVSLVNQEKLFTPFYQVDTSYTKAYGGTGLGLVISKRLIEAMGGTISFYSHGEGLGSTVILTIPLYQLPYIQRKKRNSPQC